MTCGRRLAILRSVDSGNTSFTTTLRNQSPAQHDRGKRLKSLLNATQSSLSRFALGQTAQLTAFHCWRYEVLPGGVTCKPTQPEPRKSQRYWTALLADAFQIAATLPHDGYWALILGSDTQSGWRSRKPRLFKNVSDRLRGPLPGGGRTSTSLPPIAPSCRPGWLSGRDPNVSVVLFMSA